MAGSQKHEKVVNALVKDIFLGKLKPNTKLPTEKQLSEEMQVDRTSLRLGLKQLESMKVLSIRQGDGIYVRDYLKNAGLDFLGLTFEKLEEDTNNLAVDIYLLDEIWEFWIMFWPPVLELAVKRSSTRDHKALAQLIDRQEECISSMDREKMVELLIAIQDKSAELANNTLVLLLFNSCRPLRRKIIGILFESMDEEELKEVVDIEKYFLQKVVIDTEDDIAEGLNALRERYEAYRRRMRELMSNSFNMKNPR